MNKNLRILIVEDLATDAELIMQAIKKNGIEFSTEIVDTENEYLKAIKTFTPDIILSDFSLPQFNGMDALRIKEERIPEIPFILVTGTINEDTAVECMKLGADDYVIKQNLTRLGLAIKESIKKKEIIRLKKKAEEELRISERQYKQFYEQSPIGYQSLDENGFFKTVNQAWLDTLGYSEDDVIGKWFGDFLAPEYAPAFKERFKLFKSLGQIHSEFEMIRKDGTLAYIEFEGKIANTTEGKFSHTQCVISDTTEKRRSAQIIRESEERFRSLFENSPFAYQSLDESGNFLDVNEMLCDLLEYRRDEIIGKNFGDLWTPESKHFFQNQFRRFIGIGSISVELNLIQKSKEQITVLLEGKIQRDEKGKFIRTHCILHDITNRKVIEDELAQRNKNLQFINGLSLKLAELSPKEEIEEFLVKYLKEVTGAALVVYSAYSPQKKAIIAKHVLSSHTILSMIIKIIGKPIHNTEIPITSEIYHEMVTNTIITGKSLFEISFGTIPVKAHQMIKTITGIDHYYGISLAIGGELFGTFLIGHKNGLPLIQKDLLESFAYIGSVSFRRKHAEESLHESEEKFRSIFENHAAVKLIIDPETRRIVDANNAAANYYGWNRDELIQMKMDQINTIDQKELIGSIENVISNKRTLFEFQHRRADGSIRDVEVFSSHISIRSKAFIHSIIHDITERKQNEDKVKTLTSAVEQNQATIMIVDPKGIIEYTNPMFTVVTGYTMDEVIGKNPRMLKSGEHSTDFYRELWQEIKAGNLWRGEFHNRKKNGDLYWEEAIISPILDKNGKIIHFVAVKEDITEKKKMLDDLLQAKEKAEESDRLKTEFLHNISHEVRTPMNAIIGFAEMLNNTDLSDEKRNYFTQVINQSSNRLLAIITNIIAISTIESGQEKVREREVNLNTILKNVKEELKFNVLEGNVKLDYTTTLSDYDATIITDETKLVQILLHLTNNALKFTTQGYVRYGYRLKENFLEFFIEDTGVGISEEKHKLIFERFRQAESNTAQEYGGTGLGLSISKAYIELLGGTIWLESRPGKGSIFYFSLPYKKKIQPKETTSQNNISKTDNFKKTKTVLIAEDEDFNFQLIVEILSGLKVNLLRATNGAEAVELCKTFKAIDLIVMDIKMPIMNGYEATRMIKEFNPELPIIAQTAFAFEGDKIKAFEAGCCDYISKPFNKHNFIELINKYI